MNEVAVASPQRSLPQQAPGWIVGIVLAPRSCRGRPLVVARPRASRMIRALTASSRRKPGLAVIVSFGVGVVSSLTPCAFPMVPTTVSIFGATDAQSR